MQEINSSETRQLAELLDIGLWKFNLVELRLEWDTSVYRRYGVDKSAFPTPDDFWQRCLTEDSLTRAAEEMRAVLAGERDYQNTYELKLPTGETRFVLARASLIRDASNRPLYLYGMNLDVTAATHVEQENEKLMAQLREAQAIAHTGSWAFELGSGELSWSPELHKIYEISGKTPWADLYALYRSRVHPDDQSRLDECIRNATESCLDYTLDYRLVFPDGRMKHVRGIGKVKCDATGKAIRIGGTCQDRTKEVELQQLFDRERMKSIQSAKLSSLGELAAGIAHEINNPLSIIEFSVELLSRTAKDEEKVKERGAAIRSAAQRISKIVGGLKKFSRSDKAAVFTSYMLSAILQDALDLVGVKAKRCGTKITTEITTNAHIFCDNLQIEQVLINIVSNAIDAANENQEKWVTVTLSEAGPDLVLRVINSGPRISEQVREKLFTPFFTTKRIGEGTGLGLTISKGIMDEHHATIEVNTSFANTCFELRFKKVEGSMALKILYLDDESMLCDLFTEFFAGPNVEVSAFTEARVAIEAAKAAPPDLAILDYRLPEMTGDAVAQLMPSEIPKYLVTGDNQVVPEYPFVAVFSKPAYLEEVQLLIDAKLAGNR